LNKSNEAKIDLLNKNKDLLNKNKHKDDIEINKLKSDILNINNLNKLSNQH